MAASKEERIQFADLQAYLAKCIQLAELQLTLSPKLTEGSVLMPWRVLQ